MVDDNADALEQVAEAVEESDLSDEDVEELRVLLGKLEDETGVYHDIGDLFSLGGEGYKRVRRAPGAAGSVRRYLDWREEQREHLAETAPADLEGTEFEAGFGRWEDRDTDHLYKECPICGSEVYRGKVGGHLDTHWDEIVELAEQQER